MAIKHKQAIACANVGMDNSLIVHIIDGTSKLHKGGILFLILIKSEIVKSFQNFRNRKKIFTLEFCFKLQLKNLIGQSSQHFTKHNNLINETILYTTDSLCFFNLWHICQEMFQVEIHFRHDDCKVSVCASIQVPAFNHIFVAQRAQNDGLFEDGIVQMLNCFFLIWHFTTHKPMYVFSFNLVT
jgi:hypothetical protein